MYYLGDALSCRASPLFNSIAVKSKCDIPSRSNSILPHVQTACCLTFGQPLTERLNASQSFALHGTLSHTLPETLPLDSVKELSPLESRFMITMVYCIAKKLDIMVILRYNIKCTNMLKRRNHHWLMIKSEISVLLHI